MPLGTSFCLSLLTVLEGWGRCVCCSAELYGLEMIPSLQLKERGSALEGSRDHSFLKGRLNCVMD